MKKYISILIIINLLISIFINFISCVKKYNFYNSIWVITDGGSITDKSFNESTWIGANKFIHDYIKIKKNIKANYFEPSSKIISDFKTAYITASIAGAKTIILPGFHHSNSIGWASKLVENIIYIDGSSQNINIDMKKNNPFAKNIIGILYSSEASGFFAGIASAIYLNANSEKYNNNLNISTFGGIDSQYAVSNYMWGFLVSFDIFNFIINNNDKKKFPNLILVKEKLLSIVNSLNKKNVNFLKNINKIQKVLNKNESWFSQSFEPGKGKDISDYLINKNSSIIFPVAGPQTKDTIERIIDSNNNNIKVIGVDTKQSKIYNNNFIITSALKNIKNSTYDALKNIYSNFCGYNFETKKWDKNKIDNNNCWINKDIYSKEHINWIGIESTKLIPEWITNEIHVNNIFEKKTFFDKISDTLIKLYSEGVDLYPKISNNSFFNTLKNTYDSQNKLKNYILENIEKNL